ncbi:MAG: EF-hand domain-containing protein [Bacteroidota bacterium]
MKTNKQIFFLGAAAVLLISCQMRAQSEDNERRGRKPPSIDQLFEDLDANEDGKLSKKEVKGPLKNHFDKVDLNEDGYLTREELEKAPKPERRGSKNREN